jgi:inosine-uridine nucleoside N-ribohydrolase
MLCGASVAAASSQVSAYGRRGSARQRLVIVNDDFGDYQLASENWFKYPSSVHALTQNPTAYGAPHALEGGVPAIFSEFDGGLELIYTLRDPRVKVLGVATQYGLGSAPDAFTTARQVVRAVQAQDPRVPRHIPILRGARDANDLGRQSPASRFIEREVMAHCGQVEILDTAPLTNTATALMHQPRLARCWKKLWFATGEFNGKLPGVQPSDFVSALHMPDFNINADAAATRYVLAHGGSFPILPNELMDDTWITKADFQRLAASHSQLARFVASQNVPFYEHYFVNNPDPAKGPPPDEPGIMFHGAIAAAFAIDPAFHSRAKQFDSAVVMRWAGKYKQWVFALSHNSHLPKHLVYAQLSRTQARRMHSAILDRLR